MRRPLLTCLALPLLLVGATGCATDTRPPSTGSPAATPSAPVAPGGTAGNGYADLVERLEPSVVTVRTGAGLGSGVVFRPDVVLTNQHVVVDAKQVSVEYADGTSSPGTVLATDRISDIAVIRTERGGLPVPEYRTGLPRPGDVVLAIGSPLGFEGSVTAGIVSGLSRDIPGSARGGQALVDLIQTDAAISPGNSGGALVDTAGRVVGLNEAYIPPGAGAVSIGFAIPAGTAVHVAEQLLADGTATHSYLGVSVAELTPSIRRALGVRAEEGALILAVTPDGPAARAGIQQGDVVTAFADRPVRTVEDLLGALRDARPGQSVPVAVDRHGEGTTVTLSVGTRPSS